MFILKNLTSLALELLLKDSAADNLSSKMFIKQKLTGFLIFFRHQSTSGQIQVNYYLP